jgi:hypothetical protein
MVVAGRASYGSTVTRVNEAVHALHFICCHLRLVSITVEFEVCLARSAAAGARTPIGPSSRIELPWRIMRDPLLIALLFGTVTNTHRSRVGDAGLLCLVDLPFEIFERLAVGTHVCLHELEAGEELGERE